MFNAKIEITCIVTTYTVKGILGVTANTDNPPLYEETRMEIERLKRETPAQRRRRQKKAKRKVAKLLRGLDGS